MFGIAAFFATGFAFRAQAEPGYYGCGGCWGQPALTAEQQMQAKKIFDESYEKTRKIRQTLGAKRAELDALLSSQDPDKVKIEDISRNRRIARKHDFREGGGTQQTCESGTPC